MLRALWFLLKAGAFLFALAWLTARPGTIRIDWMGYLIETTVGVAIAGLLLLLLLALPLHSFWRSLTSLPLVYRRYAVAKGREKGYRAVTLGLVSIAAGDARTAEAYLKRAESQVPDAPLTKLLAAQTALLSGQTPKARRIFADLLEDNDAAFFGLRGLLTQAMRDGDIGAALKLAQQASDIQPDRLWILRTRYDLETRNGDFAAARDTLKKAEKRGLFSKDEAAQARQALFTAEALAEAEAGVMAQARKLAEKAFVIDPAFAPAAIALARIGIDSGKQALAQKALLQSWEKSPHPDLAPLWMRLSPDDKPGNAYQKNAGRYRWAEKLAAKNPQHRDSWRLLGTTALDAGLFREAREALTAAADYRALARLEIAEKRDDARALHWLQKAEDEMSADPQWVCAACGHVERDWHALCRHCGMFNSQDWMIPGGDIHRRPPQGLADFSTDLIAPPV